MQVVTIETIRKGKSTTEPVDLDVFKGELELVKVTIIEHGTSGGDTAIGFRLRDNQGGIYLAQLTQNNFETTYTVLQGAKQNWKENPIEEED